MLRVRFDVLRYIVNALFELELINSHSMDIEYYISWLCLKKIVKINVKLLCIN